MVGGGNSLTRAAANSMARGSPSSRPQISAVGASASKSGSTSLARVGEELDRVGRLERREWELLLCIDAQRLAAGREDRKPAGPGDQPGHVGGRIHDVLEVVEDEQHPPHLQVRRKRLQQRLTGALPHTHRLRDRRNHKPRVGERRESHEQHAVGEVLDQLQSRLHGQPRLPRASRAGQRDHPASARPDRARQLGQLALAAHQPPPWYGQVGVAEAAQRREVERQPVPPNLEDPLGFRKVLEPVLAQVAQLERRVGRVGRRPREQHLAAVPGRRDAGGAVHVDARVPLGRAQGRPGVQPHAHAHRAVGQPPLRLHGRRHRVAGPWEDDEEGIALGVHLDAAVARERLSEDTAVLGQHVRIAITVLLHQPGRAVDVGKQQGQLTVGQSPHA